MVYGTELLQLFTYVTMGTVHNSWWNSMAVDQTCPWEAMCLS